GSRFVAERDVVGARYRCLTDRANRVDRADSRRQAWQAFQNHYAACIEAYAEEVFSRLVVRDDRKRAFSEQDIVRAWGKGIPVSDLALDTDWAWACVEVNSRRFGM